MELSELAFKRLDRSTNVTDYIDWAVGLLYEGSDSQSVAMLASFDLEKEPDAKQVEYYFKLCVSDRGIKLPSQDEWYEALLDYTSDICKKMVSGSLDLKEGAYELLSIAEDNNDPYMLTIWIDLLRDLSEACHPLKVDNIFFNSSLNLNDYDACIRLTAQQYISLSSISLPEKFPWVWMCSKCNYATDLNTWTTSLTACCPNCTGVSTLKNMRYFEHRDHYLSNVQLKTPN
jgi:hypothetical protein